MNVENMKLVRERVAVARESHCDMKNWNCDSVMCIGGIAQALMWALGLLPEPHWIENFLGHTVPSDWQKRQVRDWLGLTYTQAEALFYAFPKGEPLEDGRLGC